MARNETTLPECWRYLEVVRHATCLRIRSICGVRYDAMLTERMSALRAFLVTDVQWSGIQGGATTTIFVTRKACGGDLFHLDLPTNCD